MACFKEDMPMRLAVISSPRSGNTWIRSMLSGIYGLEPFSAHFPDEVDWPNLPARAIVQIHWYPSESFIQTLRTNGVRVILPMRHPFDVLISWLNYTFYVHEEGKCPGDCGSCTLVGASPVSEAFVRWVLSDQGRCVLCYGPAWFARPDVFPLRYERLVADPLEALNHLAGRLQVPFQVDPASVVARTSIQERKVSPTAWQYHFWQGNPGHWKRLITAEVARAIAAWIPEPFERLGYECDPDQTLDATTAERNWLQLQLDSVREHLVLEKAKHRQTAQVLERLSRAG